MTICNQLIIKLYLILKKKFIHERTFHIYNVTSMWFSLPCCNNKKNQWKMNFLLQFWKFCSFQLCDKSCICFETKKKRFVYIKYCLVLLFFAPTFIIIHAYLQRRTVCFSLVVTVATKLDWFIFLFSPLFFLFLSYFQFYILKENEKKLFMVSQVIIFRIINLFILESISP